MTARRLLLHPGSSQAGSTWFQNFCVKNQAPLADRNCVYLRKFRSLNFNLLATDDPAPFYRDFDALLAENPPRQDGELLVLSEERAFGDPLYKEGLFAVGPAMARNLLPLFDRFETSQVIYVWRPLDRFLLSAYNQRKKQGSKLTFETYSEMVDERAYDSRYVVEALEILSERTPVAVIDFNMLTERPRRFISEIFGLAGLKVDRTFEFIRGGSNPSIRSDAMKILEVAKDVLSSEDYGELRKIMQARFAKTEMEPYENAFLEHWKERSEENERTMRARLKSFAKLLVIPAHERR